MAESADVVACRVELRSTADKLLDAIWPASDGVPLEENGGFVTGFDAVEGVAVTPLGAGRV